MDILLGVNILNEFVVLSYFFRSVDDILESLNVAMLILDLMHKLRSTFTEHIHLCDIKPTHFGMSKSGLIKYLDADHVFLESNIGILCYHYIIAT